jgi:hypothetical protein
MSSALYPEKSGAQNQHAPDALFYHKAHGPRQPQVLHRLPEENNRIFKKFRDFDSMTAGRVYLKYMFPNTNRSGG